MTSLWRSSSEWHHTRDRQTSPRWRRWHLAPPLRAGWCEAKPPRFASGSPEDERDVTGAADKETRGRERREGAGKSEEPQCQTTCWCSAALSTGSGAPSRPTRSTAASRGRATTLPAAGLGQRRGGSAARPGSITGARAGGRSLRRPHTRRSSGPGAAGTSPGRRRCRFPAQRTRGLQGGRPLLSPPPRERRRGGKEGAEPRAGGTRRSPWQPGGSALPEPLGRGAASS